MSLNLSSTSLIVLSLSNHQIDEKLLSGGEIGCDRLYFASASDAPCQARSATTEFESYVKLNKKLPPEVVGVVQQIEDYAKLADTIAAHLALKIPDRQEMTRRYQPIAKNYFFLAPARVMLLIASGARPDFSAISRSCSIMKPRAGLSFSRPPSNSAGTRRLERCEPSS
jgi:hypothetical protein